MCGSFYMLRQPRPPKYICAGACYDLRNNCWIFVYLKGPGRLGQYQEVGFSSCKLLKYMVGERGFEPPTPWSRTSFYRLLKSIEFA